MQKKGSALMTESLLTLVEGYPIIRVYVSKPSEVDTHYLINFLMRKRQKVVVPIIERDTDIAPFLSGGSLNSCSEHLQCS